MNLLSRFTIIILLILAFFSRMSFGEGTRELQPDSLISGAGLYISNEIFGDYTRFAVIDCEPNYRLYIHIKEAGESILFGLHSPLSSYTYRFNLRKPDGTIALSGDCPQAGQQGYIKYYHQALVGPFSTLGGYDPFQYKVTNSADTGNYYFELSNMTTFQSITFDLWDFQVVSGEHAPAIPEDMILGRVWSQSWQVYADLGYPLHEFNGRFYVYSNDSIVTKLKFQNARIGAATIFCNPYGCYNTANFLTDRQSVNTNTFLTFPEIADYPVFLNDPDTSIFASGTYGEIIGTPGMVPDTSFLPCSGAQLILVTVSKSGSVDVAITFPYGFPATTVNLFSSVTPGVNQIQWNGLDGLGNPVPDATTVTIAIAFANGLTNLPIWDQETNPDGFVISIVRPANASGQIPKTFWDDQHLSAYSQCPVAPQTSNLTGCIPGSIPGYPGCHPWGLNEPDCHNKMINTWWYGSSSTATFTAIFYGTPPEPIGHGEFRCGPGSVMLHATVSQTSTVDWYDSINGGTLLHAGDTTYITPILNITTTFYAEARSLITSCTSPVRIPVVATILPAPTPTIQGPDSVCEGTSGNQYLTEPGKSNYEWWLSSGGLITSPNGTSIITVTWTEPGLHIVFVNYLDSNGCPAPEPASFRVVVAPSPDTASTITGSTPVCAGSEGVIYLVDTIPWAQSYNWFVPPGFTITSGADTNSITVNVSLTATTGDIIVYGTNLCGDGAPSPPFSVTVTYPPTAEAGPDDTICQGSSYTVTGATASEYNALSWITSGTGTLGGGTSLSPTYTPGMDETGAVTLTLISENPPCQPDSSSLTLWIEAVASADAGPDLRTCYLSPVSLDGTSAFNYQSIQWSTSGTGTFDNPTLVHPHYLPGIEDFNAGIVTLTLTALAKMPCADQSDQLLLTFSPLPEGATGPDGTICQGGIFQVTAAVANHVSGVQWGHNGAGVLEESTTLSPLYISASGETGTVILSLTAWGEGSCSDSMVVKEMQLHIYALEVDAGPDQSGDSGAIALLQGMADAGTGNYQISWEPKEWLIDPALLKTATLPLSSNTWFILTVTDRVSGCKRSDSLWIEVIYPPPPPPPEPECLEFYNVITPNGDGINDTWIITCIEQHPDNSVQIINRWGDRIRSFERYDNAGQVWDGTNYRGVPVPDGTYYYVVTIKDMEPKTGWLFVRGGSK